MITPVAKQIVSEEFFIACSCFQEALRSADGKPGLDVVYYEDMEFQKEVYHTLVIYV